MTPAPVTTGGTIPATPISGTETANLPLIDIDYYQQSTNDVDSNPPDVLREIDNATSEVAKSLNRTLIFGQYTERLYVDRLGYTWPSAMPIAEVTSPVGALVQGARIWIGFFLPLPEMPVWSGVIPPQSDVTYWGGFDSISIPPKLADIIAKVAWYRLNPMTLPNMPGGATSVHVGSVGYSGRSLSQLVKWDRDLANQMERWRRPQAHAWQS